MLFSRSFFSSFLLSFLPSFPSVGRAGLVARVSAGLVPAWPVLSWLVLASSPG